MTDDSGAANDRSQDQLAIRINHPPTAVPGDQIHSCSLWAELDGSTSHDADGDRLRFSWTFGDGTKGRGSKVVHVYDTAGRYNAKLKVQDNSGTGCDSGTDQVDLNIRQRPRSQH